MNGKVHAITAVSSAVTFAALNFPTSSVLGISVVPIVAVLTAAVGGKYADIDIEGSEYGRKHQILSKVLTHRGLTHTGLAAGIIFLLMTIVESSGEGILVIAVNSLIFGVFMGQSSHLFADLFNGKGIPLFWPIFKRKVHIASIATGTYEEFIFVGGLLLFFIAHIIGVYRGLVVL